MGIFQMAVKILSILLTVSLFFAGSAPTTAEETSTPSDAVPYVFEKGQPGRASEINENFRGLYQRVGELEKLLSASGEILSTEVDCSEDPGALREFFASDAASNNLAVVVTISGRCLGGLFFSNKIVALNGSGDAEAVIYSEVDDLGPNPAQVVGTGFGGYLSLRNIGIESNRSSDGHAITGYMGGNVFLNNVTVVNNRPEGDTNFSAGLALMRGSVANLFGNSYLRITSISQGIYVNAGSSLVLLEGSEVEVQGGERGLYFRQGSTLFDRTKRFNLQGSIHAIDSLGNSIWDRDYGAGELIIDGNVNFQDSVFVSENNSGTSTIRQSQGTFVVQSSRFVAEDLTVAGDLISNRSDMNVSTAIKLGAEGSVKLTESDMTLGFNDASGSPLGFNLLNSNLTIGFDPSSQTIACRGYSTVSTPSVVLTTNQSEGVCESL